MARRFAASEFSTVHYFVACFYNAVIECRVIYQARGRAKSASCLIGILASCAARMARALVLQLLLAGVAALPMHMHLTSKADDAIPSHLMPDAAHDRARRASARAAHGQTPRHLQLERRKKCDDVTITHTNVEAYAECTEIGNLNVRARPHSPPPALG